jgi:hypothetical protein
MYVYEHSILNAQTFKARKKNMSKVKTKGIWFILAFIVVSLFAASFILSNEALGSYEEQIVIIQPGDTLWSIAAEHYRGEKIGEAIYHIKKTNNLQSSNLVVGTGLRLPAF